jgi:diamine N-acetyltransferase
MATGRTLIRRYALALTPAGVGNEAAVMATAIPPLSGGPGEHDSEATHALTIANSGGVGSRPAQRNRWLPPADLNQFERNVADMSSGLRLEPVTQENVRAACKLKLRPDQENLVAPVAWSLADAYTVPDIAWPRLIYDGDQLVGFIMAVFDPDNPDDLFHSYLVRLNIGAEHQGSGYGSFAVEGLCQEAVRRGQRRLTVSYHLQANGPEGFYERLGFRPTGEHNQGEVVAERILTPDAKASQAPAASPLPTSKGS